MYAIPVATLGRWAEFLRLAALETDDCVIWPYAKGGYKTRPYGQLRRDGKILRVHVEALRLRVPQPPPGRHGPYEVCHGPCHNSLCMNYRHLSWGTRSQNVRDRWRDGAPMFGGPRADGR